MNLIGRIIGAAALVSFNRTFKTLYTKTRVQAHRGAVSHILHAAEHGDASTLNAFYGMLGSNDQTLLRTFVNRITMCVAGWDGEAELTTTEKQQLQATGAFVAFKDKQFHVIPKDVFEEAHANRMTVLSMEEALLNPDGKKFKPFMERNIFAEVKAIGDEGVQRKLEALINEAKGDKKNITSTVSKPILDALVAAQASIGRPVKSVALAN